MPEAVEALQLDLDPGRVGAVGEPGRIVEQDLVGSDLDEGRRQRSEIGEQRRDPRVVDVQAVGVVASALRRASRACSTGSRLPTVATLAPESERSSQGEISTSAAGERMPISGSDRTVVDRQGAAGRVARSTAIRRGSWPSSRSLGRRRRGRRSEPAADPQARGGSRAVDVGPGRLGEPGGEADVGVAAADHEAAAVDEENRVALGRIDRPERSPSGLRRRDIGTDPTQISLRSIPPGPPITRVSIAIHRRWKVIGRREPTIGLKNRRRLRRESDFRML